MKESYQSGSLPEKKGESIKNTLGKVGVGVVATVASLSIPNEAVAQHGLLGKIKDKINNTIELVNQKAVRGVAQEIKGDEVKKDPTAKEYKALNIPWEGDKIGFKYPFDKEYKSDENFYRMTACSKGYDFNMTQEEAQMEAENKIFTQEMGLTGYFEVKRGYLNLVDSRYFKDNNGVYTVAVAIEVAKKDIQVIVSKPEMGIREEKKENLLKTTENKKKEMKSTNQKEQIPEAPKFSPVSGKPEKQPEYVKPTTENTADFMEEHQKQFDAYKNSKQSSFEAFKKATEEDFDKFRNNQENK